MPASTCLVSSSQVKIAEAFVVAHKIEERKLLLIHVDGNT